ncbi:MAG TPA: hypothetical protein DDZ43_17445 [Hyphomonadaceae bacterium]|nr:hypothetical protein [Hyphomonadaceae bacterium]
MSETATEIQSYEPRDIAQRLKAYICRAASLAEAHFEEPAQNVRHSEGASSLERVACGPTGPREQNKQAGGQTSEVSPERVPCEPTGSREQIERAGGQTGACSLERVLCDPTGSREQDKQELPNPLYYEPLAHFCPPESLWASAHDEAERRDVNFIHYMAAAKLEEIGYGIRPNPYAGLPDLSCVDPPDPPTVRCL